MKKFSLVLALFLVQAPVWILQAVNGGGKKLILSLLDLDCLQLHMPMWHIRGRHILPPFKGNPLTSPSEGWSRWQICKSFVSSHVDIRVTMKMGISWDDSAHTDFTKGSWCSLTRAWVPVARKISHFIFTSTLTLYIGLPIAGKQITFLVLPLFNFGWICPEPSQLKCSFGWWMRDLLEADCYQRPMSGTSKSNPGPLGGLFIMKSIKICG